MDRQTEVDWFSAQRELRARKHPNYDAACFHAEQRSEKYLKACLPEAGIPFVKTHDLVVLLDLLRPIDPTWESPRPALQALSAFAVAFRYPGESASKDLARQASGYCRRVRDFARTQLGL